MGDIAAYMKNEKVSIIDIKLTPIELAELIDSIKNGTISGKIGKEVCLIFLLVYLQFVFGGLTAFIIAAKRLYIAYIANFSSGCQVSVSLVCSETFALCYLLL